MVVDRNM